MNIFYTSKCPIKCAEFLNDTRINKMIIETAQLLSSGLIRNGYASDDDGLYKVIPQGKELAQWAVANKKQYKWMMEHLVALNYEYRSRYNKINDHKTFEKLFEKLVYYWPLMPDGEFVDPPNWTENKSLGINYKHIKNTRKAYKMYLEKRFETDKRIPTWYGKARKWD